MATTNIYYAVEIDTLTSETDTSIGLVSGVIRLITDRPGYDGTPTYPTIETGGDITDVYYEGIIAKDGIGAATRSCVDLDISGGYATVSNFTLSLVNSSKYWNKLKTLDINLIGKMLQLYIVIDDVFYYAYNGMISETPYNETNFEIVCTSDYKNKHKQFPPNQFDLANFPDASESTIGQPVPVCIGEVTRAKVYNTLNRENFQVLNVVSDIPYYTSPVNAIAYSDTYVINGLTLTISAIGLQDKVDAYAGMWLVVFVGTDSTPTNYVKIISSVTSSGSTTLYLDGGFGKAPADIATDNLYSSGANADTWFVKVSDTRYQGIVSNEVVSSFDTSQSQIPVYTYNKDSGEYEKIPGMVDSVQNDGTRDLLSLNVNTLNIDSEIDIIINSGLNDGVNCIIDGDNRNTILTQQSGGAPTTKTSYALDYTITPEFIDFLRSSDEIYCGADFRITFSASRQLTYYLEYRLTDLNGNDWTLDSDSTIDFISPIKTNHKINLLPNEYYGSNGNTNGEQSNFGAFDDNNESIKENLKLSDDVRDAILSGFVKTLEVKVSFEFSPTTNYTYYIYNIGLFTIRAINSIDDFIYTKVLGEKQSTFDTNNVVRSYTKILGDYAGLGATYNNVTTQRQYWKTGRQFIDLSDTFKVARELATQTYIEIYNERNGDLALKAYTDQSTAVEDFDQDNIIRGSIKSFQTTQMSNIYNEFVLSYNYDYAKKDFTRVLSITNIDQSAFPGQFESTGTDTPIDFEEVNRVSNDEIQIKTDYDPTGTFAVGDYISYNADDTTFYAGFATISTIDTTGSGGIYTHYARVNQYNVFVITIPTNSSSGDLTLHTTSFEKWKGYVTGINNYTVAKNLWNMAHDSYAKINTINRLPESLSKCYWFNDEQEFTYYIGASLGLANSTYTVVRYLTKLCEFITREKYNVTFDIPITSTNIIRELTDFVTFTDTILTNSVAYEGYIDSISIIPSDDIMRIKLLLIPDDLPESSIIEETTTASDIIEETTSATDIIEEVL